MEKVCATYCPNWERATWTSFRDEFQPFTAVCINDGRSVSRAKRAQDAQDLSLPASEIATDIHT